jgi:hypothetical protein
VLLPGVEEQLGLVGGADEGPRCVEVLGEEGVRLLAVHLHRHVRGPRIAELRDRQARRHQQGAARAGPGLRELLGGHDAEREAGVDDLGAHPLAGRHAALGQRTEPDVAGEGHPVVDRLERAPVEQVGRVDGVPGLAELVGERLHSLGQPLDVVVQDDFAHFPSSHIDPSYWNVPRC